jgi:hypothetical protein
MAVSICPGVMTMTHDVRTAAVSHHYEEQSYQQQKIQNISDLP